MQQELHLEIFAARVIDIGASLTSVSHSRPKIWFLEVKVWFSRFSIDIMAP